MHAFILLCYPSAPRKLICTAIDLHSVQLDAMTTRLVMIQTSQENEPLPGVRRESGVQVSHF